MVSTAEKAATFAALHDSGCFVIPNPFDVGSARILAALGFKALTTSSAGFARTMGLPDYGVTRDMVIDHARVVARAVDIPVAGDLENGFGPRPEDCAETIRQAAEAGLVGGSIEDWTGDSADPIFSLDEAADRIHAAAEAAKSLPFKFQLVARSEIWLHGQGDLDDTIRRLQAYQEAGADVLFAPGLQTAEDIAEVCRSLDKPVNVMRGPRNALLSVSELGALGVRRVSLGNLLHSHAMTAFVAAAREAADGTFGFAPRVMAGSELDRLLTAGMPGQASFRDAISMTKR